MTKATEVMQVDGREIEITHVDKELFPGDGFTKRVGRNSEAYCASKLGTTDEVRAQGHSYRSR